jgi:ubiquinone/menaquinone biosynthesis C-methylase UbiE
VNTEEYGCMRTVEDTHWWYRGLHTLVIDAVNRWGAENGQIADVGCGTGGMAAKLTDKFVVTGLDYSPEALAFCRERDMERVARADAANIPLADDSVDIVLLLDVLYHGGVPDRGKVLQEAKRILRPGGVIIINVPAYQWLYSSHDVAVHTAHRFTRGEMNTLLKDAGFKILSSSYWNSVLLPAIVACRLVLRWLPERGSDLNPNIPGWINRTLGLILKIERRCIRSVQLPAGLSIFSVAQMPHSAP